MRMNVRNIFTLKALCCLVICISTVLAELPDNLVVLVPGEHVTNSGAANGTIGSFLYRQSDNRFYTASYGDGMSLRCFIPNGISEPNYPSPYKVENVLKDDSGVSWLCATSSEILRMAGATSIENGTFIPNASAKINGLVLNPCAVSVNGTNYDAGELAILSTDIETFFARDCKRLVSWDMREVFSPTDNPDPNDPNICKLFDPSSIDYNPDNLPDRNNAEYRPSIPEIEHYESEKYGYGCVNWNDTFNTVVTLQDMAWELGLGTIPKITTDRSGDKNVTFSTDGQSVYFSSKDGRTNSCYTHPDSGELVCSGERTYTGIWKVDLATKSLKRIFDDRSSKRSSIISSEMAVVPVGTRNLTGLPYDDCVDQLIFDGSDASGNLCGLNCLVDNGTDNPPIHPILDGFDFLEFSEIDVFSLDFYGIDLSEPNTYPENEITPGVIFDPENPVYESYVNSDEWPKIWSISTDQDGNIYFYSTVSYGVYMYDTNKRLICLKNQAQECFFNRQQGSALNNFNNFRLSTRNIIIGPEGNQYEIPQLMYMSTAGKCVAGINVYKPCDFDRDGVITNADLEFFKIQLMKSASEPPSCDDPDYLEYLKADLNGSGRTVHSMEGFGVLPGRDNPDDLGNIAVTMKDAEVLYQFVLPGNANLDNIVDLEDFAILAENFLAEPEVDKQWQQGDFDFDDDVDLDDLALLAENWLRYDD